MRAVFILFVFLSFLDARFLKTDLFLLTKKGQKLKNIGILGKTSTLLIKTDIKNLKVTFKNRSYPLIKIKKDEYVVFIPVKYREKTGDYRIFFTAENFKKGKFFRIKKGNYKKENLKVDPKKVTLSKKDKKRVLMEYKEAMKIYNSTRKIILWRRKFIPPLKTPITSAFGNARVFNSSLKSYHGGSDFRAKMNTKIKAANDGIVSLAKDRFYAGKSVIIDHGYGIYSCYYHLNHIKVKRFQKVKRGEIIGLSGRSGRVTGPHLHFAMRVNGVQVDPLQMLKSLNYISSL